VLAIAYSPGDVWRITNAQRAALQALGAVEQRGLTATADDA
jgi:hypothetical protein